MLDPALEGWIQAAQRDPGLVLLDGFHALKHALRFGAVIELALGADRAAVEALAATHAPDILDTLRAMLRWIDAADLARLGGGALSSPVLAVARRPPIASALDPTAPALLLKRPSHLGNLGACIRVAAGLGAAAVWTIGVLDPWHRAALRGSAGLHFALPVAAIGDLAALPADRPLLAFDPDGISLGAEIDLAGAVLAFGTERQGLSPALRARADRLVAIPMQPKVSSLNLATSVAVALWHWRQAKNLSSVSLS